MRIAVTHNLPSGGAKRAVYEWCRSLAQRHEILSFALSTADENFCDIRPFAVAHATYPFRAAHRFRSPFGRFNQLQRWRDLGTLDSLARDIGKAIDARRCDVVFAHSCQFTFVPLLLTHLRTPAVYYLHEPIPPAATAPARSLGQPLGNVRRRLDRIDPLIRLYKRRLEQFQRTALNGNVHLLANSEFTRRRTLQRFGINAAVCPLGTDVVTFAPLAVERGTHVLSVGELTPRKGFDFLVESLAMIPAADRPTLRIVCNRVSETERAYLESIAAHHGVRLQIVLALSSVELAVELNSAALFVYAAIDEPFGLALLESMACATPVVAVAEGGVPESVVDSHTGRLVPRDPRRFADAVSELLTNPVSRHVLGQQARAHVLGRWGWERSVNGIEQHLTNASGIPPAVRSTAAPAVPPRRAICDF